MKRIVLYISILIIGIGVGFVLSYFLIPPKKIITVQKEEVIREVVSKKIKKDSVEHKKKDAQNLPQDDNMSVNKVIVDSLSSVDDLSNEILIVSKEEDSGGVSNDEDTEEIIIKEELIAQRTFTLNQVPTDSTDVSELLNLKSDAFSQEITIEFWQSPINITGYELTRNRLKLFGFNPNESFSLRLSDDKEHLFLNTETMSILLQKTDKFKNLILK